VPFRAGDTYAGVVVSEKETETLGDIAKNSAAQKPIRLLGDGFYDRRGEKLLVRRDDVKRDPLTGDWQLAGQTGKIVAHRLAGSFSNTVTIWKALVFSEGGGRKKDVCPNGLLILLAILAIVHWVNSRSFLGHWWRRIPDFCFAAVLGAGAALAIFAKPVVYKAFIYFQF
jgi:hypothetical protein